MTAAASKPEAEAAPQEATEKQLPDAKDAPVEKPSFTFYDIFFWRDAPDWYTKTFLSAGFGLGYLTLRQYLNRHELEVFMPPRSKVLPASMQQGYRNSQMLKYGFLKVGRQVTVIAGMAATYFGGAYYLGEYRGDRNDWHNFGVSGSVAGLGVSLYLIRPPKVRSTLLGTLMGGVLGAAGAYATTALGLPLWEEGHDFEGWFLGKPINLKKDKEEAAAAAAAAAADGSSSPAAGASPA